MQHEETEAIVIGFGAAGATITWELARRGVRVIVLDRGDKIASTFQNQQWNHGGLLYNREELAKKMWQAYRHMHPLERRNLLNQRADFLACSEGRWPSERQCGVTGAFPLGTWVHRRFPPAIL